MKKVYGILFLTLVLALILMPFKALAISKQNADDSYMKGNYQQAIADYNKLLQQGVSADLYYNLGNAYYRSDNLAMAILSYERALRLSPGDKDIRFNLQFANSKTIDKITPMDDNVFATWYGSIVNFTSVDNWAKTSIVCIILALILMLTYLFANRLILRKIGFFGSIGLLIVFVFSMLFAWQQKSDLEHSKGAIVMVSSVSVKQSPVASSPDDFVLHEGTRVEITENGIRGWSGIKTGDGREGWIKSSAIEKI